MFKRFLSVVLAALIGATSPAVPAQAPSPAIERGALVSAPVALPQLAQRLPDTIPPLYMLGGDDNIKPVASFNAATDPFPSAILSYSGPSLSTMFDSTGKLTYKPNNLALQANNFANAAWTKAGSPTFTPGVSDPFGGTAATTMTATAANDVLYQSMSPINGGSLLNTLWVRRRTGSGVIKIIPADNSTYQTIAVTSTWTQFAVKTPFTAGVNGYVGVQIVTSGDAIDIYAATHSAVTWETLPSQRPGDQVITTASAYYGPRIDYDPNTLAVKGLLIEEARTNLLTFSAAFDNAAWGKAGGGQVTVTADQTTAPDGTSAADKAIPNASAGFHSIRQGAATTAAIHTHSIFYKALGYAKVGIREDFVAGQYATFDCSGAGSVIDKSVGTSASIDQLPNGWYRLKFTPTTASVNMGLGFYIMNAGYSTGDPSSYSYTGDGTSGGYPWGADIELGSSASSYTPTAAAAVTRAADVFQFTGAALTALQGSAGSAIVQSTDAPVGSANSIVYIGANGATNFPLYWSNSSTKIRTFNGTTALDTAVSPTFSSPVRAAVAWSAAGRSVVVGGGTVATDANAFTSGGISSAYLGVANGGLQGWLNGHIASFAIYNQRIPDATLQAKSVVNASY